MVYPTDNNANADWSMNDVMKSISLEYGHEPDIQEFQVSVRDVY